MVVDWLATLKKALGPPNTQFSFFWPNLTQYHSEKLRNYLIRMCGLQL